jgi:DNA-binding XRE family transcriptional regulator
VRNLSNVRKIRLEKNISAQVVINALGITHCTYYKKELGQLRFSLLEAKVISNLFDMSIEDIFFPQSSSIKEH